MLGGITDRCLLRLTGPVRTKLSNITLFYDSPVSRMRSPYHRYAMNSWLQWLVFLASCTALTNKLQIRTSVDYLHNGSHWGTAIRSHDVGLFGVVGSFLAEDFWRLLPGTGKEGNKAHRGTEFLKTTGIANSTSSSGSRDLFTKP